MSPRTCLITTIFLLVLSSVTADVQEFQNGYIFIFKETNDLLLVTNSSDCFFLSIADMKTNGLFSTSSSLTEKQALGLVNGITPAEVTLSSQGAMLTKFNDPTADVLCGGKQFYEVTARSPTTPPPCVDTVGAGTDCSSLANICSSPYGVTLCRKFCGLCSDSSRTTVTSPLTTSASTSVGGTGCTPNPCHHEGICRDSGSSYSCVCISGYTGHHCETDIDDCSNRPCQHGGTCRDNVNSYSCACAPGYSGQQCEIDTDSCSPDPCLNGGTCRTSGNSYICACAPGYSGDQCQTDSDDCSPNPCRNGGVCQDAVNSYTCNCPPGYTGHQCGTDSDDCSTNPCSNGGTCRDGVNSHTCSCLPGYTGDQCQTDINDCSTSPCVNGMCRDGVNSYTCHCLSGYSGHQCQTDIDDCSSTPCRNGGTCRDGVNSYTCTCPSGHTGDQCGSVPVHVPAGVGIKATMTVINDWCSESHFEGRLDFDITEPTLGWIIKIAFSKPVASMNVLPMDVHTHNAAGTEWTLVNKEDRMFLQDGDHYQLKFEASLTTSGCAPSAIALLVNMGKDNYTVTPPPNTIGSKYNLEEVLMKSILFYEAQRSGKLPANNRIPWRGDSAMQDGSDVGNDLAGGWYDEGDFVKNNFPLAWTTVILEWGLLEFKDAYDHAGQTEWIYNCIKWPLNYLLKSHVDDSDLYVQVGNSSDDHEYWGRPEDMKMNRPSTKIDTSSPGSDVAMETAAAFAAGYLVFKDKDPTFASTLLRHAKALWEFADKHPGKYRDVTNPDPFYSSFDDNDEKCWGSLWLYKATGNQKYLDAAKQTYDSISDWGMFWDDVIIGNQILMYNLTGDSQYIPHIEGTLTDWFPGGSVTYTPQGLAWRHLWGTLRYSANMAMSALMAAHYGVHQNKYRHWAMCQIYYALGDTGRSYVVGFGQDPPNQPYHRASSCPNLPAPCNTNVLFVDTPNPHILYGALVGGPDPSDGYDYNRNNYVQNAVAIDYNAGFQTAVAALIHLFLANQNPERLGNCPYPTHA